MNINTSGLPQTKDYLLGRGAIFAIELDDDGLTDGMPQTHLGNAPEFSINVEVETLEHQSSLEGTKTIDLEVIISQKFGFSFQLDEINFGNFAKWSSGETFEYANAASIAGFAERRLADDVTLGRWYFIKNSAGARCYNIGVVTAEKSGAPDVLLVEGTDYELDTFSGRIFLKEDAVNIAAGDDLDITLAANAGAGTVDMTRALTQTNERIALLFRGENPVNADEPYELLIHKTSLKPDGDFALIGDECAVMGFTGVAEKNIAADPDSPYATLSGLTPA